jgi:hypothetical protein
MTSTSGMFQFINYESQLNRSNLKISMEDDMEIYGENYV